MSRLTFLVAVCAGALALGTVTAAAGPIAVNINGEAVRFSDALPQQVNGRVLVPLRGVLEKLGADVHWNEATQIVTATLGEKDIWIQLGSRTARVNGQAVRLDVAATKIDGSTMVPLRFVGEALGGDVRWDSSAQTVRIDTGQTTADNGRRWDRDREARDSSASRRRDIAMRIDDRGVAFGSAKPYMQGLQVMMPLESVSRSANFAYRYDAQRQMIHARNSTLQMGVGSRYARQNGRRTRMAAAAEMHNGTLYVPLSFIGMATGGTADWHAGTRTVILTTTGTR